MCDARIPVLLSSIDPVFTPNYGTTLHLNSEQVVESLGNEVLEIRLGQDYTRIRQNATAIEAFIAVHSGPE